MDKKIDQVDDGEAIKPVETPEDDNAAYARLPAWRQIVKDFLPTWFTLPMSSGIVALLIHNLPAWRFAGIGVLSSILFVATLAKFVIFSVIAIARLILYPRVVRKRAIANMDELTMWIAWPIAFLTLTSLVGVVVTQSSWGGYTFTIVAFAMWWVATAWTLIFSCIILFTAISTEVIRDKPISTTLIVPPVGLATDALTGAELCLYAQGMPPKLQVPIVIAAYFLNGIALWIAVFVYTMYFNRLIRHGWPEPARLPSLYLLVGPCGQIPGALIGLATVSRRSFGQDDHGTFITEATAFNTVASNTVIGLLILGLDIFWILLATYGVFGEGLFKRRTTYNLSWWSTIFPLGTWTNALFMLSTVMDSVVLRAIGMVFLLIMVIAYITNLCFTIWHSLRGELLLKHDRRILKDE